MPPSAPLDIPGHRRPGTARRDAVFAEVGYYEPWWIQLLKGAG